MSRKGQVSLSELSREFGINPRTAAKWRKRATVEDLKTDPMEPRSTYLRESEDTMFVAFRRQTLQQLDDRLHAVAAVDPAPYALGTASMPSKAWHLASARRRRGQTEAVKVQAPSDRLLPRRYRRASDGGGHGDDRKAVPGNPVLRCAVDDVAFAERGQCRERKAPPASDATVADLPET
jgi:hypothetical protein